MTEVSRPPEYARMTFSRMDGVSFVNQQGIVLSKGSAQVSIPFRLLLPAQLRDEMFAQAQAELPNECCGLLAGKPAADGVGRIEKCYSLKNSAASPVEYLSDGADMFAAHRDMQRLGFDVLAVYHSHPTSEPIPSRTDRERNY